VFVVLVAAVDLPDLQQPVADASRSLGRGTYLVVGVFAFFETSGHERRPRGKRQRAMGAKTA
jgi:hypothetical protein